MRVNIPSNERRLARREVHGGRQAMRVEAGEMDRNASRRRKVYGDGRRRDDRDHYVEGLAARSRATTRWGPPTELKQALTTHLAP